MFEELVAGDIQSRVFHPQSTTIRTRSRTQFRQISIKRPAKRVKTHRLKKIFTFTHRHLNYPHDPREPSEPSKLKANQSAPSTCHMHARHEARTTIVSTKYGATCQHVNVITLYQFSDRDMPLPPFWCPYRNVKIFCIAATRHPAHSTKLGLILYIIY